MTNYLLLLKNSVKNSFYVKTSEEKRKNTNKMEQQTVKNLNVFLLGLAFMLVFAAFQTMGNVQTVILDSAKNATSGQFTLQFLSNSEPMLLLHK